MLGGVITKPSFKIIKKVYNTYTVTAPVVSISDKVRKDISYINFPSIFYMNVPIGYWLEYVVINVDEVFTANSTILLTDYSGDIVKMPDVYLDTKQSYEIPIWKKYITSGLITVTLTGTPAVGHATIIFEVNAI
ncbi:MAG: hypothetical protein WC974_09580 [Thermoplasmata archaeon]